MPKVDELRWFILELTFESSKKIGIGHLDNGIKLFYYHHQSKDKLCKQKNSFKIMPFHLKLSLHLVGIAMNNRMYQSFLVSLPSFEIVVDVRASGSKSKF